MYIVSACLAGQNCKYNGGNNENEQVVKFSKENDCVLVCPERFGNLPTPRPPSEIIGGRAVDKNGKDITEELLRGARESWEKAEAAAARAGQAIEGAILKANSPSCGAGTIYDGAFAGKKIAGDGFFTRLLKEKGIRVVTEEEPFAAWFKV